MLGQAQQPLKIVLLLVGLMFIFGVWPLMQLWPSGWKWEPNQPEYEQMFQGVYATLGVFLVIASRNPSDHRSLIFFTAWSSLIHSGIMTVHALGDTAEKGALNGGRTGAWARGTCPTHPGT